MFLVFSVILLAYGILCAVFYMLSGVAVYQERKKGEKRFDALGREF
jgi:hypothetical protein